MKRILLAAAFLAIHQMSVASADPVEDFFSARGPHETVSDLSTGPNNGFSLFRPANPGQEGLKHPVITWGNGTFAIPLFYFDFLDHLASHGFVVIATNDLFTGSGEAMLEGVDWVIEQNADPDSPLFGSIDVEAIGATGHSQGGAGAINAGNDPRVVCTAPIQPSVGNIAGLQGPTFITAGSEDSIVPERSVFLTSYSTFSGADDRGFVDGRYHFQPLGDADGYRGYVTGWFAFCLFRDSFAAQAFIGDCSLCENPNWRTLRKRGVDSSESTGVRSP